MKPTSLLSVASLLALSAAACVAPASSDETATGSDDLVVETCCSSTQPGALPLLRFDGHASVALKTAKGDAADVYYPTDRFGRFLERLGVRYPVVVVLQGAQTDKSAYATFAGMVAEHGFVVVVPNHLRALGPGAPPALFTEQSVITDGFTSVVAESQKPGSALAGRVDASRLAVVGHSFGGAASLLGVAGTCAPPFCTPGTYTRPAELKAAVVYGTNYTTQTEPKTALPIDTSAAPVAMVQGTADGRSLPALGSLTYGELEASKAFVEIEGANHFGITDTNAPAGAVPDPSAQTIAQADATARIATWTAIYLRAKVKNDPFAAAYVDGTGSFDGSVKIRADER